MYFRLILILISLTCLKKVKSTTPPDLKGEWRLYKYNVDAFSGSDGLYCNAFDSSFYMSYIYFEDGKFLLLDHDSIPVTYGDWFMNEKNRFFFKYNSYKFKITHYTINNSFFQIKDDSVNTFIDGLDLRLIFNHRVKQFLDKINLSAHHNYIHSHIYTEISDAYFEQVNKKAPIQLIEDKAEINLTKELFGHKDKINSHYKIIINNTSNNFEMYDVDKDKLKVSGTYEIYNDHLYLIPSKRGLKSIAFKYKNNLFKLKAPKYYMKQQGELLPKLFYISDKYK